MGYIIFNCQKYMIDEIHAEIFLHKVLSLSAVDLKIWSNDKFIV